MAPFARKKKGVLQVVSAAKQPPKGKKKGGVKQPKPGTLAAARKWAYERLKMAAAKKGITVDPRSSSCIPSGCFCGWHPQETTVASL